jgi:acetyl esterase/lipase
MTEDPSSARLEGSAASLDGAAVDDCAGPSELLWPNGVPGWESIEDKETVVNRQVELNEFGLNRAISRVSRPSMTPYLPSPEERTGVSIVVLPGGAFTHLAIDKEGYDVARWLHSFGVASFVLKYRTDAADRGAVISAAVEDVQRAVRTVRRRSTKWDLDPGRIGVIGFSAGGHLVASLATKWDDGDQGATDPIDRVSCRPNFLALIYPGVPEGAEDRLTGKTGPAFLVQASDDRLPVENSLRFYNGLRKAKVPAEMHLYATGGHGFGLGVNGGPVASWCERFTDWLGILEERSLL